MKKQKKKTESKFPIWLVNHRKKQGRVFKKLEKQGYGKL
jgi:hypothetical protein